MNEIRPLTGLRGVAALSVFLAHLQITLGEQGLQLDVPEWLRRLLLNSGGAVDIFFVLSGFILTMNYGKWFAGSVTGQTYAGFMRRRFARIYPLHFVMLLLVIGFVLAAHFAGSATHHGLDRFKASELPATFLLMQAWGLFFPGDGAWNPPSWSISIEALAYLLFPLLILATARSSARRPWLLLVVALLVGFTLNWMTPWGLSGFAAIARGLSEFALGCFAFRLLGSKPAVWLQSDVGSIAAVFALGVSFLCTPNAAFLPAVCCVPVLLALCRNNTAGRFFGWQPVYFLGEVSYSIYLGHFLFSSVAYRLVSLPWMQSGSLQTALGLLLIIAFVLSLSTLCYYLVERPGRNLLSGRRPATASA